MEENVIMEKIVITDPKTFCFNFDLPKDVDENLKHEIEFIIKSNSFKTMFINTENSKLNEPHKFVQKDLDLRSLDKHVALQNLSIYYTWKNIRKQSKNNKLKIIAPTWNDKCELPDGSYSVVDIQNYIKYTIKKQETVIIPPIHVYTNIINNRSMLKIKDGYKLELEMPETMKLLGRTKILTDKTKNWEKVLCLEVVEVVLVHCNLVQNQYQQKSEVLYTFTPNKSYAYLWKLNQIIYCFWKHVILSLMILL